MDNSFGKYDTKQMIWTNVRFGQLLIRFKEETYDIDDFFSESLFHLILFFFSSFVLLGLEMTALNQR